MKYVSLHHHSTFSYMDGFGLPSAHVERAAELGMSAMALTEHGNVSSHVKLNLAGRKHGVKPIFGLEAYTAPADMRETGNQRKWHLTLLAENLVGYQNLMQIVTESWRDGFYRWPTVLGKSLAKHSEGIICLSGCLDSKLACDLLGGKGRETGDYDDALKTMLGFQRLFGDRFYLETQQFPRLDRAHALNQQYEEWSSRYGIQMAATSDVHYPLPEQNEIQKILHAAGRNTGTVAAAEAGWEYDIRLTLPTSDRQIYDHLRGTGMSKRGAEASILTTEEIAARCNVELPVMDRIRYPLEPGVTSMEKMRQWLNAGWAYRGFSRLPKDKQREYAERTEYELELMASKDFLDYFLMLSDAVRHCKDHGIPVGPARGSAAASLVCYLLRITEVNPMDFPLMLFERFIDPNRHDLPDVDLDFDDELRDEVRQHMIRKYGEDRVGNIGTFSRYRGKNSLDDVARVYQVPRFEIDTVKGFLVERSGGDSRFDDSIGDTIELYPVVKDVFERYPVLYKALELEGNYKGFGVHAAGIVVGAEPLWKYCATYTRDNVGASKKSVQVLSVDKYDGEELGLMKLDALGLQTMGIIRIALEYAGIPLDDLYKIPLDDPETLAAFERSDVVGVFQFEGKTMKNICEGLRPRTFMDLAAVNALARPGPLHSGSAGDYIAIRNGVQEKVSIHPILDRICAETEGQIIYQEQILQICGEIGQLSWTHRTRIRKIISSKMGESVFNELWGQFRDGAATIGIEESVAADIWKRMVTAGTYAFNVAHCISYSMLGLWMMWLKVHYPLEFYAASLRKADPDKAVILMRDMQNAKYGRSYTILPPSLENPNVTWSPADNGVRAGLSQIPGIGDNRAEQIIEFAREVGLDSWKDLERIKGFGPKTVEKIVSFVEKPDPFGLESLKDAIDSVRSAIKSDDLPGVPMPNCAADEIPMERTPTRHTIIGVIRKRNPQDLYENHRARTGEDLDPSTVRSPELKDSMVLWIDDESGTITLKVPRFLYPRVKDDLWGATLGHDVVVATAKKVPFISRTLMAENLWVVDPD